MCQGSGGRCEVMALLSGVNTKVVPAQESPSWPLVHPENDTLDLCLLILSVQRRMAVIARMCRRRHHRW